MKDIWDKPITADTDWGGDASTGGLPVSGRIVQEYIKSRLKTDEQLKAFIKAYLDENGMSADQGYVTLATEQTIKAIKDFEAGLKIGGSLITYDKDLNAFILRANLVTEGGITARALLDEVDVPTFMDGVVTDEVTISKADGVLRVLKAGLDKEELINILEEEKYVTQSWVKSYNAEELKKYVLKTDLPSDIVTLSIDQEITGIKNFANGFEIAGIKFYKSQDGTIFLEGNLVTSGGITARGTNTTTTPSLFEALPIDSRTIKRDANGVLYVDAEALNVSGGLDEEQLEIYLTTNQYAKKSDIPSISNITYASVVAALGYTPYSTMGGTISGDIQAMRGRFVMQKNGDHTSIIPEVTALTVSTNSAGYNGYHTGIGFNALGDYGSLTYRNHIHAWIGLGGATTTAEAECYPLVFATNGSTSTGASPIERMRINPDGQVIVTGDTLLGSINLQYSDEINRYGGNLYIQHRNGDGTGHVVMCYNGGNVGIGVAYPSEKLQVNGNLLVVGGFTARYTSDERLKTNLRPINAGKMILGLGRVREFEYIDSEVEKNSLYKGSHIGLIYQDVKTSALSKMCYEREDGFGSLNYLDTSLTALLVGVAQEHEIRLTHGERELVKVKRENEALEKRIEQLERIS